MAPQYGEVRVDYITYTTGVVPNEGTATAYVSGLINNPTFSGNVIIEGDATIDGNLNVSGDINASGVVISGITGLFDAGTEALPSIAFALDPNTGIYNPSANEVGISTDGNERLRVDNTGNVGIGTTSPTYQLELTQDISARNYYFGNTGAVFRTQDNTNGLFVGGAGLNYTTFTTNGSERARIDSSGRLGIGTSTPGAKLEIADIRNSTLLRLTAIGGENWDFKNTNTVSSTDVLTIGAVGSTANLALDDTGRVGIGTSPSYKLHVSGNNSVSADNTIAMGYGRAANPTDALHKISWGSDDLRIEADTANTIASNITFTNDGTERARIDSSGRLLVGTSSPVTSANAEYSKLQVIGNASGATGGYLVLGRAVAAASAGQTLGVIYFTDNTGGQFGSIACDADAATGSSDYPGKLVFSTTADGASSPTERARITSGGYFKASNSGSYSQYSLATALHHFESNTGAELTAAFINSTATSPYGVIIRYTGSAPNNTGNEFLIGADSTTNRFVFRSNGGLANYSANNVNLSDINTKKDISPVADTWNCLKEWEIVNFRYKDQPDDADLNLGVIAQQVAESCPEVITVFQEATEDQPEKLGVKEQQMYWMAIKALQEAQARIEQLESKVAALESA